MRLIDKIISMGPNRFRDPIRRHGQCPVVLVADEIASHYYLNDQMEWGADDFPYARPPWNMCFVEWHETAEIKRPEGIVANNHNNQIGTFVAFSDKWDKEAKTTFEKLARCSIKDADVDCVAMLSHVLFNATKGTMVDPMVVTFVLMSKDGRPNWYGHTGIGLNKTLAQVSQDQATELFNTIYHIVSLAFTFSNCSNVKLEDVSETLAPEPKVARRLQLPKLKRYTLNICGHSSQARCSNGLPTQAGVMPFHLCRGHFATYTEERPLFGKHVGRFWIPPHTKGREERGKIEKDYEIK